MSGDDDCCVHCGGDVGVRNPKGFCDHLYYPDSCGICVKRVGALGE